MIVVLDSNIWISLAINQQLDFIESLHKNGVIISGCEELLNELTTVLSRPKFNKHFTQGYIEDFIKLYRLITTNFPISDIENVVADQKDNYLFALCKISNTNYFITGDKLLIAVNHYHKTRIITLNDFKNIYQSV